MPGVWLERGCLDASDTRLLTSPAGLDGMKCLASIFFVTGSALHRARKQRALDAARDLISSHTLASTAGATSPNAQVVVVRVLAPLVEPAMELLRTIRAAWRTDMWNKPASNPRIWST
jgi:urease accessory protein